MATNFSGENAFEGTDRRRFLKHLSGVGAAIAAKELLPTPAVGQVDRPPVILVSGMDSLEVLRENLEIARSFTPMKPEAMQALRDRCASHAADGRFELYKTYMRFDSPPGREQHGFPSQMGMAG